VQPLWNPRATAIVTFGRYAAWGAAERIMKREFSDQGPDLSLIVAMWIAVGLLLAIGLLTV
jgi:hypothetical protein